MVQFIFQLDQKEPRVLSRQQLELNGTTFNVNDAVFLTFGSFHVDKTLDKGSRNKHPGKIESLSIFLLKIFLQTLTFCSASGESNNFVSKIIFDST